MVNAWRRAMIKRLRSLFWRILPKGLPRNLILEWLSLTAGKSEARARRSSPAAGGRVDPGKVLRDRALRRARQRGRRLAIPQTYSLGNRDPAIPCLRSGASTQSASLYQEPGHGIGRRSI